MSDSELILIAGALLAVAIAAAMVADRMRVPGLLLFLGVGMLVGQEGPFGVEFHDVELTQTLGVIGLSLILFEGGLTSGWKEIRPVFATAFSLALVGTLITTVIAGLAASWILDIGTLEGLIVGAAIAATDAAAIFAVLRGSTLRRRLARALEGESGMNDPIALLLVIGFIDWIQLPDYGIADMAISFVRELGLGAALGVAVGFGARWAFQNLNYPTQGLYPVASIAAAALSYGSAQTLDGSGFFAVYMTGLMLGTGVLPAQRTIIAFHQGLGWISQIAFFFVLGLLVVPSGLGPVAGQGLLLSAVLMFFARPVAAVVASLVGRYRFRERLMLGWAGLRGAIPIWLATFPVIAGIAGSETIFNVIFFVVVTSTLIQGMTFEPLAERLGLTTTEPALPRPLVESGRIRRLGGDVFAYRLPDNAAAGGHMIKELGLPREALVNVIVRGDTAIPPRGSTVVEGGDELHILVRRESREAVEALTERWEQGPIGAPRPPLTKIRGAPTIFTVKPWLAFDGDPSEPLSVQGIEIAARLRSRRDQPGGLVVLADGRFAVTGERYAALGGKRQLAVWCAGRAARAEDDEQARAWWQEVAGVLNSPGVRRSK